MANRLYNQFQFSHEKMVTTLYGKLIVGTTGAVTTVKGTGIKGIVRNSTGNYTVTFVDKFAMFLTARFQMAHSSASAVGAIQIFETVSTLHTDVAYTNGTLVFQCLDFAGSAVDPESGSEVILEFVFRNSSAAAPDAVA
jgi:hypothetical protein